MLTRVIKAVGILLGLGLALQLVWIKGSLQAQTPSGVATIFEKRCYSCHNIGGGDKKGPDLKGVTAQLPGSWFREFIKSAAAMNRKGDPTAVQLFKKFAPEVMPDQELTDDQIDALMALIDELSKKNQTFVPAGARLSRPVVPADVAGGRSLFIGKARLSGGGAACISCHNLKGIGALGGGTLGPDLTAVNIKYRDPELISILQNPNFPTMKSVFATHPPTDEEIVQLFALFQNSKMMNPTAPVQTAAATVVEPKFLVLGVFAVVLALFGSNRIWKNRLRGVREEIVRRRKA